MKRIIFFISMCFISFSTMNAQEPTKIKITVGANSFIATTYNNVTAKAFIALLPLTVTMNELNGNEKYHYLSGNLPGSAANPSTINNGDLMLYGQNCLVLFYETFATSYSYTKIGIIDDTSGLKSALGSGNPIVKFELINTTGIDTYEFSNTGFEITNNGILQVDENVKKVSLMDMNGRTLLSSTSNSLNVNSFPKGIYILLIESKQKTKVFKIKI